MRALLASVLLLAACSARVPLAPEQPLLIANQPDRATTPPLTLDEALLRWRNLAPTGATLEQVLASLPEDEDVRRAMALAVLHGGNVVCEDLVDQGCGQEEIGPLAADATFESPCLRRQLALWALDELGPDDGAALRDVLIELVSLREPETELQEAAFGLVADDDDALRLTLIEHADEQLAESQSERHLEWAAAALDVEHFRTVAIGAINDDALSSETRGTMLDQLGDDAGADVTAALIELADHGGDCGLAMTAAELLVARGDASHLPVRPLTADAADHLRALCLLNHDSDEARRTARLARFFGKPGMTVVEEVHEDFWRDALDLDGDGELSAAEEAAGHTIDTDRKTGVTIETDGGRTVTTTPVRPADIDPAEVLDVIGDDYSCTGLTCEVGDTVIELRKARDGGLHVDSLHTTTYNGCGC